MSESRLAGRMPLEAFFLEHSALYLTLDFLLTGVQLVLETGLVMDFSKECGAEYFLLAARIGVHGFRFPLLQPQSLLRNLCRRRNTSESLPF